MTEVEQQEFFQYILNRSNTQGKFSTLEGIHYDTLDLTGAEGHFVATQPLCNPFGIVHGGVYYTVMDQLAGMMASATGRGAVTLDCSVSYLKSAKLGETVYCRAKPIHVGRSVGVYEAECVSGDGVLQCKGTFHMFFLGDVAKLVKDEG